MSDASPDDDAAWRKYRSVWRLRRDTTYLNHGSFGPPPEPVRLARRHWLDRLDEQPMDFFVRILPGACQRARERLAKFVGADVDDIVLTENATFAMNIVADSLPLRSQDEVVLTDHEYGVVRRIWQRACRRARAADPRVAQLPLPCRTDEQILDALFVEVTPRTRLIVVSHITSPTGIILPVQKICARAAEDGIPVCVDGPHALLQTPLEIRRIGCTFYTASCHKWLSAPFGSGLLFVHPSHQIYIQPQVLSWGTLPPAEPRQWSDEFLWSGTRDPTPYLSIPAAIDFFETTVGLAAFRQRSHYLARLARQQIMQLTKLPAITPDSDHWYGSMVTAALPDGHALDLQRSLWKRFRIEAPIIDFGGRRFIRVSCHLYNTTAEIQRLVEALGELLREESS